MTNVIHTCLTHWCVCLQAEVVLEGHSAPIRSVVTTGRGRFVVTASEDNTARVWDLQAAAEGVIQSQAHGGRIKQVSHSASGGGGRRRRRGIHVMKLHHEPVMLCPCQSIKHHHERLRPSAALT
jgi:WD40 repeat protein